MDKLLNSIREAEKKAKAIVEDSQKKGDKAVSDAMERAKQMVKRAESHAPSEIEARLEITKSWKIFFALLLSRTASILFLSNSKQELSSLALGFFLSLIVIIKPTLFPLLILLPLALAIKPNRYLLVGISLPFLVEILYLVRFDLLSQFYNLTIRFNADSYLSGSQKIPTLRFIRLHLFVV